MRINEESHHQNFWAKLVNTYGSSVSALPLLLFFLIHQQLLVVLLRVLRVSTLDAPTVATTTNPDDTVTLPHARNNISAICFLLGATVDMLHALHACST